MSGALALTTIATYGAMSANGARRNWRQFRRSVNLVRISRKVAASIRPRFATQSGIPALAGALNLSFWSQKHEPLFICALWSWNRAMGCHSNTQRA